MWGAQSVMVTRCGRSTQLGARGRVPFQSGKQNFWQCQLARKTGIYFGRACWYYDDPQLQM